MPESLALVKFVQENNLEPESSKTLIEKFQGYFEQAEQIKQKAESIVVTDASQVVDMKVAREYRLALKEIRVNVEHTRKTLKEDSLRRGKAIDGIANVIKFLVEPIESHLEQQEKFVEFQEMKKKQIARDERIAQLSEFNIDITLYNLLDMPENQYQALYQSFKIKREQEIELARRMEEERLEKERKEAEEKERMRLENERLKKEAEERERVLAEERKKAEIERKANEEKLRKEREKAEVEAKRIKAEQDAKLKKEREERERLELELKRKRDAEEKAKREQEEREEQARSASDKVKLIALAEAIESISLPEVKSVKANKTVTSIKNLLTQAVKLIR